MKTYRLMNLIGLIALILSYSMLFAQFSGGSGTVEDPWHIANEDDLMDITFYPEDHFIQIADIELDRWDPWVPIVQFLGSYDGNYYRISNLNVSGGYWDYYVGLIGENLGTLIRLNVTGNVSTVDSYAGIIVGYNQGIMRHCASSGSVDGYDQSYYDPYIGGLTGKNSGTIISSYSDADVTIDDLAYYSGGGGLVGLNTGTIENSYAMGTVKAVYDGGGFVAWNQGGSIENCYSTGNVSLTGGRTINDFPERNDHKNSRPGRSLYIGGLIGYNSHSGTVSDSYWDTQTSGQATSAAGEGRTTIEMSDYPYDSLTYLNWDFGTVWQADEVGSYNNGYPRNRHECRLLMMVAANSVDIIDTANLDFYLNAFNVLKDQSLHHSDGWGISYFESGSITTGAGTVYPRNSASFPSNRYASWEAAIVCPYYSDAISTIRQQKEPKIILGHIRTRTTGPVNVPNPHPFVFKKVTQYGSQSFTFAHNGGIDDPFYSVLNQIRDFILGQPWSDPLWAYYANHEVDSGRYFGFIMAHIKLNDWDVLRGLKAALSHELITMDNWSGRNFVFSDGFDGYAFRSKGERGDDDYTLEYQIFTDIDQPSIRIMSKLPRRTGDPPIIELKMDELVHFPRVGHIQRFQNFNSPTVIWRKEPVRPLFQAATPPTVTWDSFPVLFPNRTAVETMEEAHLIENGFDYAELVKNILNNFIYLDINNDWQDAYLGLFNSGSGYKMYHNTVDPQAELGGWIAGDICDPLTTMIDLVEGSENWTGYWLLNNQSVQGALGSTQRSRIHSVQSRNWFWLNDATSFTYNIRYPMEFGQMYKIILKDGEGRLDDFQWVNSRKPFIPLIEEENIDPPTEPGYFSFNTGSGYQIIEVQYIEEYSTILEVGVKPEQGGFQPVIGAVYDGTPLQIVVNGEGFEGLDLKLFYWDGNQEFLTPQTIEWYDFKTEQWEEVDTGDLVAGNGQYHIIRISGFYELPDEEPVMNGGASPNPFNPDVTISFSLSERRDVEITVYNIKGQRVKTLARGEYDAGRYSILWQGKNENNQPVGSGVYFYRIRAGKDTIVGKMLMLK